MPRRNRQTLNSRNLHLLVIVVQSFAAFAALSTFLGRIYFVTYYDALGIPASDVRVDFVDYATISPNVTFLGIALAALSISVFFNRPNFRNSSDATGKERLVGGLLWVFGFTAPIWGSVVYDLVPQYSAVTFGLILLGGIVMIFAGLAILDRPDQHGSPNSRNPVKEFLRRPLIAITVMMLISVTISSFAAAMVSDRDAFNKLNKAPTAHIKMSAAYTSENPHATGICEDFSDSDCVVRVIFIGNSFTYVVPVESDVASPDRIVIAIPTRDIGKIVYTDFRDRDWRNW